MLALVESGAHDGTRFHGVRPGEQVAGGDPNSRDENPLDDGRGGPGFGLWAEIPVPSRPHFPGTVSMAGEWPRALEGLDVARRLEAGDVLREARVVRKRDHAYEPRRLR